MQVQHMGYRIRGFYRVATWGHRWDRTPQDAHERLKILRFFARYGLAATVDAFGVSRRTLDRWKAATPLPWPPDPAPQSADAQPQDRPAPDRRDPATAPAAPPPGPGQAACVARPLVCAARHPLALGLHPRPHHRPRPGQEALCARAHRPPGQTQASAAIRQAPQTPRGAHTASAVPGGRHPRARP